MRFLTIINFGFWLSLIAPRLVRRGVAWRGATLLGFVLAGSRCDFGKMDPLPRSTCLVQTFGWNTGCRFIFQAEEYIDEDSRSGAGAEGRVGGRLAG